MIWHTKTLINASNEWQAFFRSCTIFISITANQLVYWSLIPVKIQFAQSHEDLSFSVLGALQSLCQKQHLNKARTEWSWPRQSQPLILSCIMCNKISKSCPSGIKITKVHASNALCELHLIRISAHCHPHLIRYHHFVSAHYISSRNTLSILVTELFKGLSCNIMYLNCQF